MIHRVLRELARSGVGEPGSSMTNCRAAADEQRRRLAALVNSSEDAMVSETADGIITSWSSGAERLFGYLAADMIGRPTIAPFLRGHESRQRRAAAARQRPTTVQHFDAVCTRKDGGHVDVAVTMAPVMDDEGRLIGFSHIASDLTLLRRAQSQASASEGRYCRLFDSAQDGILILDDATGLIVDVNPALTQMLGRPRAAFVGAAFKDVASFTPLRAPLTVVESSPRDAAVGVEEVTLRTADGGSFEVQLRKDVYVLDCRTMVQYSLRDISERRRSEAKVEEGERRFLTMANSMSRLAWIASLDGAIIWCNQRWYEYTGATLEEMKGSGWQRVHHPDWLARVMSEWGKAIAEGQPFEMDFPLRGIDGRFRMFHTRALPFRDTHGHLVQWFGTNTDIDVLKRSEEFLRRSEQSLAAAQTRAKIGSWEVDLETQEVVCSAQLWRILGREPPADPRQIADFLTLHPDDRHSFEENFARAVERRGILQQQARVVRPDGSIRWIEILAEPVLDETGQALRMVGTSQDVTERKLAEDEVRRLNTELEQRVLERTAQLEAANTELDAFSYSVAHDLRAPLRAVNGFADMVLEDFGPQLPDKAKQQLRRIRHGGDQMGRLIDDLLQFSRLSREPLNCRHIDTRELVSSVVEELKPKADDRQVEIDVGDLPGCYGDPALLKQVWANLLSNALKYSRAQTLALIELGCQQDGENVYFVRDNGVGFDMAYAHKLFGVFRRLHRAEDYEGTGVGLAIVQRIVCRHGGRAWGEGIEDRGATFFFTLAGATAS